MVYVFSFAAVGREGTEGGKDESRRNNTEAAWDGLVAVGMERNGLFEMRMHSFF